MGFKDNAGSFWVGSIASFCISSTLFCILILAYPTTCKADAVWPSFNAVALTGKKVESERLVGQPALVIITPSRSAADDTRRWVKALRKNLDQKRYRIRDVLAINLPFFISNQDAIQQAREVVPEAYHDQTWLLDSSILERQLGIPPGSKEAYIIILNQRGKIVTREHGTISEEKLNAIESILKRLHAADKN